MMIFLFWPRQFLSVAEKITFKLFKFAAHVSCEEHTRVKAMDDEGSKN